MRLLSIHPIKNIASNVFIARYAIFGLLLINLLLFVSDHMILRSIDALAWLLILVCIEWPKNNFFAKIKPHWYQKIQLIALGMISLSCSNSYLQHDWISLANEITWLCVLLLPATVYTTHKWLKPLLYISLASYATYWGMSGALMEYYDAVLWIIAFLELEYENNPYSNSQTICL